MLRRVPKIGLARDAMTTTSSVRVAKSSARFSDPLRRFHAHHGHGQWPRHRTKAGMDARQCAGVRGAVIEAEASGFAILISTSAYVGATGGLRGN
jgi:hypothetical protein